MTSTTASTGAASNNTPGGVPTITTAELQQLLTSGSATLIDALPAPYYEVQHLPGALNLAPDQARDRAAEVLPDKTTTVVTYCSGPSCSNSTQVAQQLRALGYADVRAYHGGIEHWVAAGLSLEPGTAASD